MKKTLLINQCQEGNQLLNQLKSINSQWVNNIYSDYSIEKAIDVLFLSLKYHRQYPTYIETRVKKIPQNNNNLKILLLLIDVDDPDISISKLNIFCIYNNLTLILAFSYEEAGNWILTCYKSQNESLDLLNSQKIDFKELASNSLHSIGFSKKKVEEIMGSYHTIEDCLKNNFFE